MALTPNYTYVMNGVTVNEKIIPDGTRWKSASKANNCGFSAGSLYKKNQKLTNKTGKVLKTTVHNTNDLKNVNDDAEQYTRATYNENMRSSRVHFYVDDVCAWQNLKAGTGLCPADPIGSAEVSWHAGDGSVEDGGNMTSLSMEIIMNDNAEHDAKAKDNGARMLAWLIKHHGLNIDDVVSHTYWVNKSAGRSFDDVDEQCTSIVSGEKWCPFYIFGSTYNEKTARKNWDSFKDLVMSYYEKLVGSNDDETAESEEPKEEGLAYEVGDIVFCRATTHYTNAKAKSGYACKPGKAKITATADPSCPHPYHCRYTDDSASDVYGWVDADDIELYGKVVDTTEFEIGDTVYCKATTHYTNAKATSGPSCKPGKAEITDKVDVDKYPHPYHCKYDKDGEATVYGWVDADDVEAWVEEKEAKDLDAAAKAVIRGEYGNGAARKENLRKAGFSDEEISEIQNKVNAYYK